MTIGDKIRYEKLKYDIKREEQCKMERPGTLFKDTR